MYSVSWRGATTATPLLAALALVPSASASASCAELLPIEDAIAGSQTVFVGTVTDLEHDGRVATFDVVDVWKGDPGATATVSGGPSIAELDAAARQGQDVATSVDRTYELGQTYLVVSYGESDGALLDNACSATQPFDVGLERHRPAGAPGDVRSDGSGSGWPVPAPLVWGGLALIAAVAIGAVRVRTHRSAPA